MAPTRCTMTRQTAAKRYADETSSFQRPVEQGSIYCLCPHRMLINWLLAGCLYSGQVLATCQVLLEGLNVLKHDVHVAEALQLSLQYLEATLRGMLVHRFGRAQSRSPCQHT